MPAAGAKPLKRPGVVVKPDGDRYLVSSAPGMVVALNESALALWQLCDGTTDPEEMATAVVSASAAVAWDQARRDVASTLDQLADAGLITWEQ